MLRTILAACLVLTLGGCARSLGQFDLESVELVGSEAYPGKDPTPLSSYLKLTISSDVDLIRARQAIYNGFEDCDDRTYLGSGEIFVGGKSLDALKKKVRADKTAGPAQGRTTYEVYLPPRNPIDGFHYGPGNIPAPTWDARSTKKDICFYIVSPDFMLAPPDRANEIRLSPALFKAVFALAERP